MNPNHRHELLKQTLSHLRARNVSEALAVLQRLSSAAEPIENQHLLLAVCYLAISPGPFVLHALEEELRLFPNNARCRSIIAAVQSGDPRRVEAGVAALLEDLAKEDTQAQNVEGNLLARFADVTFGLNVQIRGVDNTVIGRGSCICDGVLLNVGIRDAQIRMVIGQKVLISRYATISSHGFLEIGDFVGIAPHVYIADAEHGYGDIFTPLLGQPVAVGRKITIEENCWLGFGAVICGAVTIGRGSVVSANAVVLKDVPPFSVVSGNPAKVVKMYNPFLKAWGEPPRASEEHARLLPSREEYRETLRRNGKDFSIPPVVAGKGECL